LVSAPATDAPRGAAPSYIVTDLGTFGTVQSAQAFDVNDAGQVVGIAGNRAFLWLNGTKTALGTLANGSSASASGINEAGQVVGYSALTTPPSGTHAALWSSGTITDLTPDVPANQGAAASAVNEAGQVVGNISYGTAFLWQNNALTFLGDLGGGFSFANDINDAGVVVGSSYTSQMTPLGLMQHPFMWKDGVMTDLGLLAGAEDGGAAAINNLGQIVGSSGRTDPDTYESFYSAFFYSSDGGMTKLPVPSPEAYAGDINDAGECHQQRGPDCSDRFRCLGALPRGAADAKRGSAADVGRVDRRRRRVRRQQRHVERRVPADLLADDQQPRDSGLQHGQRNRHRGHRLQRRDWYGDDSCRPDHVGGLRDGKNRSETRARRNFLRESLESDRRDDRRWPGSGDYSERR
jgi:probable HAF family extracellular repeat protein